MIRRTQNEKLQVYRNYWRGRRVTVMGLGINRWGSGWSAAKFFASLGARVTVTDQKSIHELKAGLVALKKYPIRYILGRHRAVDFRHTELVIKNPGVPSNSPFINIARKKKIPVETDISIFFMICDAPIIGVTGSRGKSTSACLIHHIIKAKWPNARIAGNIGTSPLRYIDQIDSATPIVIELSSWLLESLAAHRQSPNIAVITNLYREHLNRYKNYQAYQRAKSIIVRYQRPNDLAVFNADQPSVDRMVRLSRGRRVPFGMNIRKGPGCWLRGTKIIYRNKRTRVVIRTNEVPLVGEHNIANVMASIIVGHHLGIDFTTIKQRLKTFTGVPERLEVIHKTRRLTFIDDTTATSPEATICALNTVKRPVVLIAGGTDKGLNYSMLARTIVRNVYQCILLPGTATDLLLKQFKRLNFKRYIGPVQSMDGAVTAALRAAPARSTILLSPGAASFGLFRNEFDRGRQFKNIIIRRK